MWRQTQEQQKVEFEEKFARIEKEGTQEFMSTGRVYQCTPASYQYIHLNTSKTFTSSKSMLEDAVGQYLKDPDKDLAFEELLYKNLKTRCEQKAKVFMQTCGKTRTDLKIGELQEKLARIDTYGSNEFVFTGNETDTEPKTYEYVHLNEYEKYTSKHSKIADAIT
ncbi:Hypothetical predicted protein [Paramuricea clavata]|uniref:Uncharacterized protein n=1 Tax=Paramuricea clavata TaxID=317549 RepID=A0A6S7I6P8_PARCT|nr:Hypothetical predicted protein [Paramuricea clavata]